MIYPAVFAACLLGLRQSAAACAACECGDATLTSMGAEQPFPGRLRASVSVRHRSDQIGSERTLTELDENRVEAAVSWNPIRSLGLMASIPLLDREVTTASAIDRSVAVGDLDLTGKLFVYRDRDFAPRHLLATMLGVRLPIAAEQSENGRPLPPEAQPSVGALSVSAGLSYATLHGNWMMYASFTGRTDLSHTERVNPGASLFATALGQWQPTEQIAMRFGLDGRLDAVSKVAGVSDPNSGGQIVFAMIGFALSPATDLSFDFSLRVPMLSDLRGAHDEGPIVGLGATYDL